MHAEPAIEERGPARLRASAGCLLVLVLAAAAVVRFAHPGTVEYRRDEANLSRLALTMARGEEVPLLGIGSSIGIPNPPLSVWVFVPPYLAGNDPVLATQWVGLLALGAVLLTFVLGRRWYGTGVGLLAAGLFAVGPWPAIFARKIWAQDVLPLFVLLTLATGVRGFLDDKRWARCLHLPLLSITGQIYYGSFVLIPASLYLLGCGRRRLDRAFWIGVGLTVLTVVPFALGAVQAWNALPPGAAEEHLRAQGEGRTFALSADVLYMMRDALGGSGALDFVAGEARAGAPALARHLEPWLRGLGWVALLGCAWLIARALRPGARRVERALALWLVATPVAYACAWTELKIHYMIPMLPVGFLACALLLRDVGRATARALRAPARVRAAGLGLLAAAACVVVASQLALLDWVGTTATPGGFGVPLGRRLEVRADVLARPDREVTVVGAGTDVVEDGEAAIWDVLLSGPKDVRFVEEGGEVPAGIRLRYGCAGPGRVHAMRPDARTGAPEVCYRVGD